MVDGDVVEVTIEGIGIFTQPWLLPNPLTDRGFLPFDLDSLSLDIHAAVQVAIVLSILGLGDQPLNRNSSHP